jgi:hypothetical protein
MVILPVVRIGTGTATMTCAARYDVEGSHTTSASLVLMEPDQSTTRTALFRWTGSQGELARSASQACAMPLRSLSSEGQTIA